MAIKNHFSSTGNWAKHAVVIAALGAMSALLGSCGGGGAASTTALTPTAIPLAVLPATSDIFADVPVVFSVSGGSSPYTAGTSNAVAVPAPTVSGSTAEGFKFTLTARAVSADTPVTITIRDSLGVTAALAASVRPTVLNNTVTIEAVAPSGTGCAGICAGGDAKVTVTAVVNGIKLVNRPIRFDVFQGDFRWVTPGTNVLVSSLIINSDENGQAQARLQATVTAPTQVATLSMTDTVTGLVRRANFNIIQTISGVGILSVLPSGSTTFTAPKAVTPGQPGQCPTRQGEGPYEVDQYIYGGTPPYQVTSPLFNLLRVSTNGVDFTASTTVFTNGGSYRVRLFGCGNASLNITDKTGRTLESPQVIGVAGAAGDAVVVVPVTPPSLTILPNVHTLACGETATTSLSGFGVLNPATITTPGVPNGALTINAASSAIPGTISFTRNRPFTVPTAVAPAPQGRVPTTIVVNVSTSTLVALPITLTLPAGAGTGAFNDCL